jgi:hypothetical protein
MAPTTNPTQSKNSIDGATALIDWFTVNEPVEIAMPRIVWSHAPPPNRHERRKAAAMRRRKS